MTATRLDFALLLVIAVVLAPVWCVVALIVAAELDGRHPL